jgi:hypothetical protein
MGIKLGMEAKLYYDPAGVGGGTWNELTNVKDVTLNLEAGEADVTTRGNAGWRATVSTLRDGSIEFEMVWDTADAGFTAIKDAYFSNTPIGFAVMDGDIITPGSQGLQADMAITNFSRNEALEEAIMVSVTAKPTYSATAPAWVTI